MTKFNQKISLSLAVITIFIFASPVKARLVTCHLSLVPCPLSLDQGQTTNDQGQRTNDRSAERSRSQAQRTNGAELLARGREEFQKGNAPAALELWLQAEAAYKQEGWQLGVWGAQLNQAEALQTQGFYRRSISLLNQLVEEQNITNLDNSREAADLEITAFLALGKALQQVGDLKQAQAVLQRSLELAENLGVAAPSPQTPLPGRERGVNPKLSEINLVLGNLARVQGDGATAQKYYQQAAATAEANSVLKVQAGLNELSLLVATQQLDTAAAMLAPIEEQINQLPIRRGRVYGRINFADSLALLGLSETEFVQNAAQQLAAAVTEAQSIGDVQGEAHALVNLGKLYEQKGQFVPGQKLTEQALAKAQGIGAADIVYRASWQLGRLLQAQGNLSAAISAYTEATTTIQSLRSDLVAISSDVQFSFRDTVEPVYRQFVSLLLQPPGDGKGVSQENLQAARRAIESLQLAELDNFFRDACLNTQAVQVDQIDPHAAVIYPIILPDRLEVILSLPGQPLQHYATTIPANQVEQTLLQLQQSLTPLASNQQRLRISQQVYDWLIRPALPQLEASKIETLVFVPDGFFRNVPLSVIHDGTQYLIEKYSIALTPGLQLLDPKPIATKTLRALTGGLSQARDGFVALPAVEFEIAEIQSEIPTSTILNQDFTKAGLKSSLEKTPFPVVHLATHGQFSSKAEDTFILTWDGRINVTELDELLRGSEGDRAPIELLVFSACQTAAGDNRAALGLAGVAVRSGARSTLATLWSVQDQATAMLMVEFYRQLALGVTKAEALRQAQLSLLQGQRRFNHPFFWAPFVLVGNWL
ncbi:MAG TPA: CHAT domain-containing protein [Oscillatoriaceae cyanobacterium M33_DOE_052]|uniref:CHAT domain-containing protein n=1 Tax=Planktothricoides sp. SpSt-374 TaxID=2282167 RepID=A0A7C3ZN51_9CYAN|nr:CHAT domain-containing protein [Oscillatoriaceae cyanobacterium M33_DOE_052]